MHELTRRTVLGGAVAGMAGLGGCLGFVTGQESLTFESDPATVASDARSESGYEQVDSRSPTVEREFEVGGQTRTVEVTNRLAIYEKAVDLGPLGSQRAAFFTLFTTPKVEIASRTFNPIAELSLRELLEQFQSRAGGFTIDERVGSETVSTLGTETTVEKYAGTATIEGQEIDVYLHATRVEHGDDFVVALGAYPQFLSGEEDNVLRLIENVQH